MMPTLMSKIITALTDISARLVLSRWQWSCNWELWTDLSRCRLLQCWGAMLQIMQLQSGPGPLPVRHTGKYSGALSDSWCYRLRWNIHPATHARCHLRGALQPRAPSLSFLPRRDILIISVPGLSWHRNNPDKHWPGGLTHLCRLYNSFTRSLPGGKSTK